MKSKAQYRRSNYFYKDFPGKIKEPIRSKNQQKNPIQECIQVGCIPPAAVVIGGVGWISSPSISPLGVGLHLILLNFSLGCGPGSDLPQFPPWVWTWT